MKIVYLHQHFKVNSGGTRSFEFSKYLVKKGHDVVMSTGNEPYNTNIEGIQIKTTKTKYSQHFSFVRRIISFIHFMIKSTVLGFKEKKTDLFYATSTPLTIGFPVLILSKLTRKRYVFEVRDVWPDIPIQLGIIKSNFLKKILFIFEKIIYNNAEHIIVLSEGMKKNLLNKNISEEKITVITNLSMNKLFDSISSEKRNYYKDKLLCIHPGTMGIVNGVDFILNVAEYYPNESIVYLLIGEGNQKNRMKDRINRNNIKNVIIEDSLPKDKIIKKIKQADVGIMSVDDYDILKDNSANKFFDYLAAGLSVLINYPGWQKEVLETNKAGKSFEFNNEKEFYYFLLQLYQDSKLYDE